MRVLPLTALLLVPAIALGAPPPNPADYPLTVHVISSNISYGNSARIQVIEAMVGPRHLQLTHEDFAILGPLVLADYQAKMTPGKNLNGYDDNESFTLLLPDGKIREFYLSGILPYDSQ